MEFIFNNKTYIITNKDFVNNYMDFPSYIEKVSSYYDNGDYEACCAAVRDVLESVMRYLYGALMSYRGDPMLGEILGDNVFADKLSEPKIIVYAQRINPVVKNYKHSWSKASETSEQHLLRKKVESASLPVLTQSVLKDLEAFLDAAAEHLNTMRHCVLNVVNVTEDNTVKKYLQASLVNFEKPEELKLRWKISGKEQKTGYGRTLLLIQRYIGQTLIVDVVRDGVTVLSSKYGPVESDHVTPEPKKPELALKVKEKSGKKLVCALLDGKELSSTENACSWKIRKNPKKIIPVSYVGSHLELKNENKAGEVIMIEVKIAKSGAVLNAEITLTDEDVPVKSNARPSAADNAKEEAAAKSEPAAQSKPAAESAAAKAPAIYKGEMSYEDGSIYKGQLVNGIPHGEGVLTFVEGDVFTGHFANGQVTGAGVYKTENGSVYEGVFENGVMNGHGKLTDENGNVYEGDFVNDTPNGKGRFIRKDGAVYSGDFVNGKKHGEGEFRLARGITYKGGFKDDKLNGSGELIFTNGEAFRGNFLNGTVDGEGRIISREGREGSRARYFETVESDYKYIKFPSCISIYVEKAQVWGGLYRINIKEFETDLWDITELIFKDGSVYKGQVTDGKPYGEGTMKYADGNIFEGFWADGSRIYGTMKYKSGTVYIGEWENNKYGGIGKMVYPDHSVYEGEWKEGRLEGWGTFTNANGVEYWGEFVDRNLRGLVDITKNGKESKAIFLNGKQVGSAESTRFFNDDEAYCGELSAAGKPHGKGVYVDAYNNVFDGTFSNGQRVEGRMYYTNGDYYEGGWSDNVFSGYGVLKSANGDLYKGYFRSGVFDGNGTMTYNDGTVWKGEWKNGVFSEIPFRRLSGGKKYQGKTVDGLPAGYGIIEGFGERYSGSFLNGKRHGFGLNKNMLGEIYEGEWKDDKYNGSGVLLNQYKDQYKGQFENGVKSGLGQIIYADGNKYTGTFDKGKPNGWGRFVYKDGSSYIGQFLNGKFYGNGTFFYANGMKYTGDFKSGERWGDGVLFDKNGNIIYGGSWKKTASQLKPESDPENTGSPFSACFIGHSAGIIETPTVTMIFDCAEPEKLPPLTPGKPIKVFASHSHSDHFNPDIFKFASGYNDVEFFLGDDIKRVYDVSKKNKDVKAEYLQGNVKKVKDWGTIVTLDSTDEGVAFVVMTDNKVFFHAGDLAIWNDGCIAAFEEYTEPIRGKHIDFAFLPMNTRVSKGIGEFADDPEYGYKTVRAYFEMSDISYFTPIHSWGEYRYCDEFADTYPEYGKKMYAVSVYRDGEHSICAQKFFALPLSR